MELEPLLFNQVRPRSKTTYFCRLCRRSDVRACKTHLRDYHKADYRASQNKAYTDIIKVLFVRNV